MTSPNNLQLDSESSNVAEWSASMATPTNRQATRGSPFLAAAMLTTGTATTTEDESEDPTTDDESLLELRRVLNDGMRERVKEVSRRHLLRGRGKAGGDKVSLQVTKTFLASWFFCFTVLFSHLF